jgi:hypothetical protein
VQIKIVLSSLITSLFLFNQIQAFAGVCSATSGDKTTPLLELYTSAGCSSCPPADRWISQIQQDKTSLTPLAFHVDYWDDIGWKDQFSKAE